MGKCEWCGGDLIWDCDYTASDYWGPSGDEQEDNRLVACYRKNCGADVVYTEAIEE